MGRPGLKTSSSLLSLRTTNAYVLLTVLAFLIKSLYLSRVESSTNLLSGAALHMWIAVAMVACLALKRSEIKSRRRVLSTLRYFKTAPFGVAERIDGDNKNAPRSAMAHAFASLGWRSLSPATNTSAAQTSATRSSAKCRAPTACSASTNALCPRSDGKTSESLAPCVRSIALISARSLAATSVRRRRSWSRAAA